MAINDIADFNSQLESGLGTAFTLLGSEQVSFAINQALNELGFTLPINDQGKSVWALKRAIRHSLDVIRIGAAHKFKYKQISLNQRFEHYNKIIENMDNEFQNALENDPALMGVNVADAFGVYIDNGIIHDQYGRDVSKELYFLGYDIHNFT